MATEVLKRDNNSFVDTLLALCAEQQLKVMLAIAFNAVIAEIKFGTKRPLAILVCC